MDKILSNKVKNRNVIAIYALSISIISVILVIIFYNRKNEATHKDQQQETAMQRIQRTGVLKVGFGGFPPYTIVDLTSQDANKKVKGFCVEMIDSIAMRCNPPLKVEWYNLQWENFNADMNSGKFDFLADGVYATMPKAFDFNFTQPFSFFGIGCAVVRKDEDRFKTFDDLNRSDITISVAQAYVSTEYAKAHLLKPKFKTVIVGADPFSQLDDVIMNRADVALQDVPSVIQYVRNHSDKVKALWIDHPPSEVAGCFVTRKGEQELLNFLNTAILILKTDGTLDYLDKKWKTLGHFEKLEFYPAEGLK